MPKTLLIIVLALTVYSDCYAMDIDPQDADNGSIADFSSEDSIYSYDPANPPDVFFFPKERARWDGSKVTLSEWYMLTDTQKEKFINEYVDQLQGAFKMDLGVSGADYMKALNMFSAYSTDKSMREPSTKFIDILLSGQGKVDMKDRTKAEIGR